MKPLLVGECNPYQSDEEDAMRYALFPEPERCSGWRLCHVIMGLDKWTYLKAFERTDLCHPEWSIKAARVKASRLIDERWVTDVIVLCGAKVAGAFGLPSTPFTTYRDGVYPVRVVLPHPSGLNRLWSQPGAVQRARDVLREAGVLPTVAVDERAEVSA